MSVEQTEAESAAIVVSPTTRVSLADIEANILYENSSVGTALMSAGDTRFNTDAYMALRLLTIHLIVLNNGFIIVGKSAPADAVNYNAELSKKFAREDAIRQIWPIMAYALKERMAQ